MGAAAAFIKYALMTTALLQMLQRCFCSAWSALTPWPGRRAIDRCPPAQTPYPDLLAIEAASLDLGTSVTGTAGRAVFCKVSMQAASVTGRFWPIPADCT